MGEVLNCFLIQSKFGQLGVHKVLLTINSSASVLQGAYHLLGGLHSGQVKPVLQLVMNVAQNSFFFWE